MLNFHDLVVVVSSSRSSRRKMPISYIGCSISHDHTYFPSSIVMSPII